MRHFGTPITPVIEGFSTPAPQLAFISPTESQQVTSPVRVNLNLQSCAFGHILIEEFNTRDEVIRTLVNSRIESNEWVFVFDPGPVRLRAQFCDYFERCTDPQILDFTALPAASTIYLPIAFH
ncbi:MAG: hypothetical protein IPJ88_02635 [Myxococcales bacterium]|nr:MAG: hypothetical protein IPJ88_02635 [Myxococcales bacterium]